MESSQKPQLDPKLEAEVERQFKILSFGTVEITPENEFKQMLRTSIKTGKPLRVKCGIDPTGTDVHLGHTVPFRKMRQFQDLGHIGVVIIGDYTASIGDPTGRNEARPPLTAEQIKINSQRYMEQVYTVLNRSRTELCYQTEWFSERTLRDVISWAAQTTVAKLLSHETFRHRLDAGNPLQLHELFYPVLQGVDSVYVKADVELGGSDQKFNVLMGRDYQKNVGMRQQVAMLLPIITGTCGTQKMSKSLGNTIGILDEPFDKFGKIMSIPDRLMLEYFQYIGDVTADEFEQLKAGIESGKLHPNETKKYLAQKVVGFFHGKEIGEQMRAQFEAVFKKGGIPDDTPEYAYKRGETLLNILLAAELVESKAEGRRLLTQNAISLVDGDKLTSPDLVLDESFAGKVLKVGKRRFVILK
jgi:tyrosyl-tRNA synthetase